MYDNQVNQSDQSIDHKIMYVGPPPKPVYFAWINSNNSITWNYEIKSMLILKRFKIVKNSKVARRKEDGGQILLKMGFWVLKTLRMKALETWSYLKTGI